jgi:tetratricopeptide (TPR) repeat protein
VGVAFLPGAGLAWAQLQQSEYQQQQEQAARYEPAPLLAPSRPDGSGPSAVIRARFYADDEYRSSSGGGRWQDRVRGMLASLNKVVEPTFGVRFEAEGFRRWQRQGAGGALQPMLEELERLDPGPDVDWVIGLVSPLPLVSMSFHDLGGARVLGRHFVLRGMSSIAELDDFKKILPKLDQADREQLYSRRKLHKELSIFLHEWAHTLGALHVEDGTRIMGPGYSNRTSTFSAEDAGLIAAGLGARLEARGKEAVDWAPLRKFVEDTPGDWVRSERTQLLGQLKGADALAGSLATRAPTVPIPGLGPPGSLSLRRAPPPETGPGADARRLMARGQLTAASRLLAGADRSADVRAASAELLEARRRLGLPPAGKGFALPPESEEAYAAAIEDASRLMRARKLGEAQAVVERGLKKFAGVPGLLVLKCELLLRQSRPRAAGKPCTDALAIMDDLPQAHYLLGCIHAETGQADRAITSLKRAIELDRNDQKVWDALAQLYRGLGRGDEYAKFAARHGM